MITKVITQEEIAFLRTLSLGIKKFEAYISQKQDNKVIDGDFAFELFDTYGFPIDLTQLMAKEKGWSVDMQGYNAGLEKQKDRSRQAAQKDTHDWIILKNESEKTEFVGYESLEAEVQVIKYRKISEKKKDSYQIILNKTPFYAESGGQVGDRGWLEHNDNRIIIEDTRKENDLIVHIASEIPADLSGDFFARVDRQKRLLTTNNHSATHLMHAALRKVLGSHVEQKGSLVDDEHTRFDFSHFAKVSDEEILQIEKIVNEKIRENVPLIEKRNVPMKKALEMGATALFGEKYGEEVRVITFDPKYSVELCGGTHVNATGQIGLFKIISEGAIAAGVRRIEAITAIKAEEFVNEQMKIVADLKLIFKGQKDIVKAVENLTEQNTQLQRHITAMNKEKSLSVKSDLIRSAQKIGELNFIAQTVEIDADTIKDLAFNIRNEVDNLFLILGNVNEGKAGLTILISDSLVGDKGLNAGQMIREIAKEINGGGGGQPHFATAGGKNPDGLAQAFEKARKMLSELK